MPPTTPPLEGDAVMSGALAKSTPRANRAQITASTAGSGRLIPPSRLDGSASVQRASSAPSKSAPASHHPEFPHIADGLSGASKIVHFPDAFAVWLRSPMSDDGLAELASLCGGKLRVENRKSRFNPDCVQRLVLRQASRAAIALLAKRNDVHFNYQELAQDLIYATAEQRDAAYQFVIDHALMKDRRGQSAKVCLGEDGMTTLYSGSRGKPDISVTYPAKSKITKDRHALHSERRIKGPKALKRKGLSSLRDLLDFDHVQFWQDNSHYYRISDRAGLGRAYLNHHARLENPQCKSRKKSKVLKLGKRATYDTDARMGHQLERVLGLFADEQITLPKNAKLRKHQMPGYWSIHAARSIQNVYDRLSGIMRMDKFMERVSLDAALAQSAIGGEAPYMRGPELPAKEKGQAMSNRYGHDPLDRPEQHISRYQRAKSRLSPSKPAESGAAKAPIIDERKSKRKVHDEPAEKPARKGGPLPSDFVWYDYPLED